MVRRKVSAFVRSNDERRALASGMARAIVLEVVARGFENTVLSCRDIYTRGCSSPVSEVNPLRS